MSDFGRLLVIVGIVVAVVGAVLMVGGRVGLGRLPGDFSLGRGNVRVYLPLASSLLVSVVLTVVLNLLLRR